MAASRARQPIEITKSPQTTLLTNLVLKKLVHYPEGKNFHLITKSSQKWVTRVHWAGGVLNGHLFNTAILLQVSTFYFNLSLTGIFINKDSKDTRCECLNVQSH
jgi:hypothetical protein